jgi:hypothetical protein
MTGFVRCAGCGRVVGRLVSYYYGGETGDAHEDYNFVPNDNFGGECESCGDLFCRECGELGAWIRCDRCSRELSGGGKEEALDYAPFYRAVVAFANHKISRSMFELEWNLAQGGSQWKSVS